MDSVYYFFQQKGAYSDVTSNLFSHGKSHNMERYSNSRTKAQMASKKQVKDENLKMQYYGFMS